MKKSLMIYFVFLVVILLPLNSIEISLEENKAESGTVGYVDIVKIYNKYSIGYKLKIDKLVEEKQKEIDEMLSQLNYYKSQREKLKFEYELAKMYEDFIKKLASQIKEENPDKDVIQSSNVVLSTITDVNEEVFISTSIPDSEIDISSTVVEEPYIVMPGIGKMEISKYKFSISSSTVEIEKYIKDLDERIENLSKNVDVSKSRYDSEIYKKSAKENEYILKKIYEAIENVAKEEGISIVVDKKSILYGRKAVDITEKVLKKLEE